MSAVREAPAHPLALGAAALVVVNDFVLREAVPGWLSGKLSDVGWLVVVPVLLASLLARVGIGDRVATRAALIVTAAFYTALQLWPPLGQFLRPGHVADAGDLLVLNDTAVRQARLFGRKAGTGGAVEAGQPLLELANVEAQAAEQSLISQRNQLAARLDALRQQAHTDDEAHLDLAAAREALQALDEQLDQRREPGRHLGPSAPTAAGCDLPAGFPVPAMAAPAPC